MVAKAVNSALNSRRWGSECVDLELINVAESIYTANSSSKRHVNIHKIWVKMGMIIDKLVYW